MKNQDYFNMLTKVEQKQYRKNWGKDNPDGGFEKFLTDKNSTFYFLDAFFWIKTPQGSEYWQGIEDRLSDEIEKQNNKTEESTPLLFADCIRSIDEIYLLTSDYVKAESESDRGEAKQAIMDYFEKNFKQTT